MRKLGTTLKLCMTFTYMNKKSELPDSNKIFDCLNRSKKMGVGGRQLNSDSMTWDISGSLFSQYIFIYILNVNALRPYHKMEFFLQDQGKET